MEIVGPPTFLYRLSHLRQVLVNCAKRFLGTPSCNGEVDRPYVAGCIEDDVPNGLTLVTLDSIISSNTTNTSTTAGFDTINATANYNSTGWGERMYGGMKQETHDSGVLNTTTVSNYGNSRHAAENHTQTDSNANVGEFTAASTIVDVVREGQHEDNSTIHIDTAAKA